MFSPQKHLYLCVILYVLNSESCSSEPGPPLMLVLYSPGDPEYTDVLVKQVHDNLTLACELRGDTSPRSYVWNYVTANGSHTEGRPFTVDPVGATTSSRLLKTDLQLADSGHYLCSAPPFSVTKYVLVQTKGPVPCARGAFVCGARCVLLAYVCDGRADCARAEDEDERVCGRRICARADKLNCSSGRCISDSACCRGAAPLCRQPACCDEFTRPAAMEGYVEAEYPPLFEDRRAPDDYGFIQSTIYTVTACALIFMIAVVLLVSAVCKMHMKRAALRGYTHADRATTQHYSVQYHQAHRFPPCYEASRLLEEARPAEPPDQGPAEPPSDAPRGLARLSSIFSSRYRQVPTQPADVEMTHVPPSPRSPARSPPLPFEYRSPTFCSLDAEYVLAPGSPPRARDLNLAPAGLYARRNTLERVMDQLDRQRLTLQLGRFQLSLPRFGRPAAPPSPAAAPPARPDTPTVPAAPRLALDELELLRLHPRDTYTLNGRTIRLLGANFEDCPVLPDGALRPPAYSDAVRYKLYGPPPEYLSREGLNRQSADAVDEEAASNVEMPPCYDDLTNVVRTSDAANGNTTFRNVSDVANGNSSHSLDPASNNANAVPELHASPVETLSSIIDNLPAIDSDVNANDADTRGNDHVVRDNVANNVVNSSVINNNV